MIAMLICVGALFVAVVANAIIHPWPQPSRDDDRLPPIDVTTLPI